MKFILTGSTGFIGSEILLQVLRNPCITTVIALSRRQLPDAIKNPKLQAVGTEVSDPSRITSVRCMGTMTGDKVLEIDYPLAFGTAFSTALAAQKKRFRYVHLSGVTTAKSREVIMGLAESNMLEFAKKEGNEGLWETVIVKPGFVITKDGMSPRDIMGCMLGTRAIKVNELAAMMIHVAMNGSEEETLQDNQKMVLMGRTELQRIKE